MYEKITGENAYEVPMRIYPAVHYTMGGTWVDYNLMSTIPGLFVLGEANFSDHGANRLGRQRADAGPGRRLFRPALHDWQLLRVDQTSRSRRPAIAEFKKAEENIRAFTNKLLSDQEASAPSTSLHRELGKLLWEKCGMARNEAGLKEALKRIPGAARGILEECQCHRRKRRAEPERWNTPGAWPISWNLPNCSAWTRLHRRESCGGHFREEFQTPDGEAQRDDENFSYVAAWEYQGADKAAGPAQGTARLRRSSHEHEELQMNT